MAKVLMVIAQQGFRDEELLIPKKVIEKAGHSVKVASIARSRATGILGAVIMPDLAIHEANPEYFDAVVIVGGPGSSELAENKEVISFLEQMNLKEKLICGICLGPMALANAGVLSGKNATVFPSRQAIDMLRRGNSVYRDRSVIKDGNVITSNGPESADEFGEEIVRAL